MNIIEHNDNLSIKQASDIERYLLRIIQKYFDIQYVETQNSIEAIIVESLTRVKRDLLCESSFVFDINGNTGCVTLDTVSLGGEPAFNKNTAFNKDFASNGQSIADTVCMGNDLRLSNKRNPNHHNHDRYDNLIDKNGISVVDTHGNTLYKSPKGSTLGSLLEKVKIPSIQLNHIHSNYDSVLKRLIYTGNKTEIDLGKISTVKKSLQNRLNEVNSISKSFPKQVSDAMSTFKDARELANTYLEYVNRLAKIPPVWYTNAIEYIDNTVRKVEKYCNKTIDSAVTQEELQKFIDNVSKKYIHVSSISSDDIFIGNPSINVQGRRILATNIIPIILPDNAEKISKVEGYFKYDVPVYTTEDSDIVSYQTITIPLPYIIKEEDGNYVMIRLVWNDNSAYIEAKVLGMAPEDFTPEMQYKDESIIYVSDTQLTYSQAENKCNDNNCRLCVINSQDKLDFVLSLLSNDKEYYINGVGISEQVNTEPRWLWYTTQNSSSPMTFVFWEEGYPELSYGVSYIFLNQNKKMQSFSSSASSVFSMHYIYEYVCKRVDSYYFSPRVSYEIYTEERED